MDKTLYSTILVGWYKFFHAVNYWTWEMNDFLPLIHTNTVDGIWPEDLFIAWPMLQSCDFSSKWWAVEQIVTVFHKIHNVSNGLIFVRLISVNCNLKSTPSIANKVVLQTCEPLKNWVKVKLFGDKLSKVKTLHLMKEIILC
jgi:hypothetical protein